jgi:hypothetical protein
MGRLFSWIINTIVFYLKASIFLAVLLLLFIYGTAHAAIYGGPIASDDAWFLYKVLFFLLAPGVLAFAVAGSEKRSWGTFTVVFFAGCIASLLLACSPLFSWGTYTHAPSFREAPRPYSIEAGKLAIPEENRELLMRDCGFIGHEGMKDSCQVIVYCQSYGAAAYERMGCEELLRKSTSPALLDLALQERRDYEHSQR